MARTGTAIYPAQPTNTTFAGLFPGTQDIPGATDYSGQALVPENNLYPGSATFAGQGQAPLVQVLLSFDDLSDGTPNWTYVADSKVRSFGTSRGRDSELSEFDAGSASVVLANRDRAYDPTTNASIRPMNQVWLREQFSGETHDLFKGYVESWDQEWPGGGWSDAIATASAADEFKVATLGALPTTSPPRDTYADLIQADQPSIYWRMGDPTEGFAVAPTVGSTQLAMVTGAGATAWGSTNAQAIVGEPLEKFASQLGGGVNMTTSGYLASAPLAVGADVDIPGGTGLTIEGWFQFSSVTPAGGDYILIGPAQTGTTYKYELDISATGIINFVCRNSAGTAFSVVSGASVQPATWYHIMGISRSGNIYLYINGVLQGSTPFTGSYSAALSATANFVLGDPGGLIAEVGYTEIAFYRYGINSARAAAHYQAGVNRGFPYQTAGVRIGASLDASSSSAPRSLQAGVRNVQPRYMKGQAPKGPIDEAVAAEAVDAAFFTSAGGTLVFLASNHRSLSPYNTSLASFGDGTGELAYLDVNVDYSESFLANEWNVTRDGDKVETQTVSDATSIARYFKRSQSLTGLALVSDADASTVATAMLAKYKNPMLRVTQINFNTIDPDVAEALFRRDLMDKITVIRTAPGGGARISQALYIQKIEVSGANDGGPISVTWGVSPL